MTLRGYWVLAIAIVCELASIAFSSKFLFLFAIFTIFLLIISIINMFVNKSKIHVSRKMYPEKPNEETEVLVTLNLVGAKNEILIKDYFDNGKHNVKFFFNNTVKDLSTSAQYKFHAKSRGTYIIGPLIIEETDCLGLITKNHVMENTESLLVYPKVEDIPLPDLPLQSSDDSSYFDANASSQSEDLFGLKEYTPGDDTRLIHWKTSSRTRKLFVRYHEPISTKSIAIVLDLDTNSYEDEEEFENAIRFCASLCHSAESSNRKTIFLSNDEQDMIYDPIIFLDKLCSQTLCEKTVPINELYGFFDSNQSDVFAITGSKGSVRDTNFITFRIFSNTRYMANSNHIVNLYVENMFMDYRQWVEKWNALEASV